MTRPDGAGEQRAAELAATLGAVRARLAAACERAGRDPREVALLAVTKNHPAGDIAALARLGVLDVGESKEQEARVKRAELGDSVPGLRWHAIGRIQSNKARALAGWAAVLHSVDRLKLVPRLAEGAAGRPEPVEVYVQVSLDDDPDRGGVAERDLAALADSVAGEPALRLRGLMAVPPIGAEPGAAFARLQQLSQRLQADHPTADGLSAGMSSDLEAAVAHGSTLVRVGTALLGRRSPQVG